MNIILTELALENLENLKAYISNDSPKYAMVFIKRLLEQIEHLKSFPLIGRILPKQNNENLRELLFHSYRIIYMIKDEQIFILTVVHGKKDQIELE